MSTGRGEGRPQRRGGLGMQARRSPGTRDPPPSQAANPSDPAWSQGPHDQQCRLAPRGCVPELPPGPLPFLEPQMTNHTSVQPLWPAVSHRPLEAMGPHFWRHLLPVTQIGPM